MSRADFFDVSAVLQRRNLMPTEREDTEDEKELKRIQASRDEELLGISKTLWFQQFREGLEQKREALLARIDELPGAPSQCRLLTEIKNGIDADLLAAKERFNG